MSGTIPRNRDETLCDVYIKFEYTSHLGHFWKHPVHHQFYWKRLFQFSMSEWSYAQTKLHQRGFFHFSRIAIAFPCRRIIYHTGVTYSCGDTIITKQSSQLMKVNPNMRRSVDILAALFTCNEASSYRRSLVINGFILKFKKDRFQLVQTTKIISVNVFLFFCFLFFWFLLFQCPFAY